MGHGRNLRRDYRAEEGAPEIGLAQTIGKVREVRDKGIVLVDVPQTSMQPEREPPGEGELTSSLAYLPPRFRGVLFIRRGSFVVLSPNQSSGGEKMTWSIETLLRLSDIKELRVTGQWPSQFDALSTKDLPVEPPVVDSVNDSSDGCEDDQGII